MMQKENDSFSSGESDVLRASWQLKVPSCLLKHPQISCCVQHVPTPRKCWRILGPSWKHNKFKLRPLPPSVSAEVISDIHPAIHLHSSWSLPQIQVTPPIYYAHSLVFMLLLIFLSPLIQPPPALPLHPEPVHQMVLIDPKPLPPQLLVIDSPYP